MPEFNYDVRMPKAIGITTVAGLDIPNMALGENGMVVRRPGADPTRDGRGCRPLPFGTLTTDCVPMSALTEVFGVAVDATWLDQTSAQSACALQVSVDGGTTYLAWDGADWSAQNDDETYNSVEVFNDHCSTIPLLNPRSLGFRLKATTTLQASPRVRGIKAYVEWDYAPMVDIDQFVLDLLKRVRYPQMVRVQLPAAATRFTLNVAFLPDFTLPVQVYNLNTDPLMNVDLFDSMDVKAIVLTEQQAAGSWMQVKFLATSDIFIAHQDEMTTSTRIPSVVAMVGEAKRILGNMSNEQYDYKIGETQRRVRTRRFPELVKIPLELRVVVAEPRAAREALEALRDTMRAEALRSPSSGTLFTIVDDDPGHDIADLKESVDVARWYGHILAQFPARQFAEYEGARGVTIFIGSESTTWEEKNFT